MFNTEFLKQIICYISSANILKSSRVIILNVVFALLIVYIYS